MADGSSKQAGIGLWNNKHGGPRLDATTKDQPLEFLKELEKTLNSKLPGPTDMESWIRSTVAAAKTDDKQKHLRLPEAAFLNGQALPVLFDVLETHIGLSREQAQQALLNEYHRTMPGLSRQSPIRWERHPFRKILGSSTNDIYRGWKNPEQGRALTQSCPDFSLRDPFPHSILFEGKYFPRGSLEFAQRQLVTDIYQAFFYRGRLVSPRPRGTRNGTTTTPVSWYMTLHARGPSLRRGQPFIPKLAAAFGKATTCTS